MTLPELVEKATVDTTTVSGRVVWENGVISDGGRGRRLEVTRT